MIFRFTVVQNRKNILKNISFISSIPSNSVLAEPIISILTNEIQWEKHLGANDITLIISRFNYNYVSTDTTARKDKVTWDYIPEEDTSGAREAAFPGGMRGFMNYVAQSFNYPKRCQKKKINGTVLLEFVIGINGAVKKIRVISETEKCPEFAQEAIRVLTESPRWIPGTVSGGILVNSYRTLPIQLSVN